MRIRLVQSLALGLIAVPLIAGNALAFDRVQPPELAVGQRASLGGSFASTSYSPSDVSRGGFSLAAPFAAPKDRGELLARVFPSYSPDNGLSAWGMGFSANLQITRWRVSGNLQYDFAKGDELTSPFGHLTRGTDGNWYPVGLDNPVRVVAGANDTFVAYHPDGSQWTFGGTARIVNGNGTYAWYLTKVTDPVGHTTTLTWQASPSGNLFLASTEYGGRKTSQYQITLEYEPVVTYDADGNALPKFVDYRSGAPVALDQRVTKVNVLARNAKTGRFGERWHYTLSYVTETVGAAFYLSRIDQTFASGEQAPPVTYTYNFKSDTFASSQLSEVPQLTALIASLGAGDDVLQSSRAAVIDADADGNADLELADDARTLVSQKGSGTPEDPLRFETSAPAIPSAPPCSDDSQLGCFHQACKPATYGGLVAPRMLSQLNPTDTSVQVVSFLYDSGYDTTSISICRPDGVRTALQTVPTAWQQSNMVRFVDLNADHLPDLIRVHDGTFDILPNRTQVAGSETQVAWDGVVSGMLLDQQGYPLTPSAIWISDMSGDGVPDLVGLSGDAIEVWHGLGNFQFVPSAQKLQFLDRQGYGFTGLSSYSLLPADLNKDGLQDYFVTNSDASTSRFVKYFTNVGGLYLETPVAGLDSISFSASPPVIATLDGSGNLAVTVTDGGKAFSVALDSPGTGLMATADDGRGTVLSFEYARGPASPGIRHRSVLLEAMHVQSSGYDTVSYDYQYSQPTVHTIGHFLVGFGQVTRREGDLPAAPLGTSTMSFLNGDDWSGLLVQGTTTDVRLPDVAKVESRAYTDQRFFGIPYKRLASSSTGWRSADAHDAAIDVTTYDAYANEFCPSKTTLTSASHGTLVTETVRAEPAAMAMSLHCLEGRVVQTGKHSDASLDFTLDQSITRNDAGRITQIATAGASGPLVQQTIAYDAENDPKTITVPGRGTTTIAYDPATKLPSAVTTPDGVVVTVSGRDPLTDATLDVLTDRGGMKWNDYATYDGRERASTHWDDLDGSSAQAPHEHFTYSYATTNHPATVQMNTLVDAQTGVYRKAVDLYTAANEKMGSALLHDAGWVMSRFDVKSRAKKTDDQFEIATQPASASFATIDYATLLTGWTKVGSTLQTTLGTDVATTERLHADVTKATTTNLTVQSGALARTTRVPTATSGTLTTTSFVDPSGKLQLRYVDEAQTSYAYEYDALGRLRDVALPDGTHHSVSYDEYGRQSAIVRQGIARITSTYVGVPGGTTDLPDTKVYASAPIGGPSVPQRSVHWTYDAVGRKRVETHTDLTSSATKAFTFFYDGATPAAPQPSTAERGLVTGVSGAGYTKTFVYRADGKPLHRELALAGFRTIGTDLTYREDGSSRDEIVTVKDPSGAVITKSAHHEEVDGFGRPSKTSVNGTLLAATTYDAFGRVGAASFSTGDYVAFAYDDLTREMTGFDQTRGNGAWSGVASTRVKKNERGFVGQERLGIGASSVLRTYSYSPQGFLWQAIDGAPK